MDLIECLKNNGLIVPEYSKCSIIDLVRTIYKYCGYSFKENSTNKKMQSYIKNKKHIVFILVDGMGSNLIDSLPNDMLLKMNKVTDLITVFPTTTACVLSSVATAEFPIVHGIIGWYNYNRENDIDYYTLLFKERRSKTDLKELGIMPNDIYVYNSIMNKLKRKTMALFPKKIVDSEFSKFFLNKNRISYNDIEDAFQLLTEKIKKNIDVETFSYLYIPDIDSASHNNGVYSSKVINIINVIDAELKKLKQQNIEDLQIIITADHGQIDITEKAIVMDFVKYGNYFYALPGIDYGTATYYVKEDKREEFLKEFKNDYKEKMFIFETEKFIKNNIMGNDNMSQYMKSNLGEYISFCKKGAYFVNNIDNEEYYVEKINGSHSGFSKEEMTIPLIVI